MPAAYSAYMRPKERMTLRAIRAEHKLKKRGIEKYNKRFRAWGQQRLRKYNLALPTVLTTDTALMVGASSYSL